MLDKDIEERARYLFVEKGLNALEVVQELSIPRLELGMSIARNGWRAAREEFVRASVLNMEDIPAGQTIKELREMGGGLDDHASIADELASIGKEIAGELRRSTLTAEDLKRARSRAEAFRTTVEATDRAVRLARDVRGLRLGQPSGKKSDDVTEVIYHTAYEVSELETIDKKAAG